jgi:hypothetical protein
MRFKVKLGNEIIGFSELAGGDAPIGAAGGWFLLTPAYISIQPYCIETAGLPIPGLTVNTAGGAPIECSGGVQIIAPP